MADRYPEAGNQTCVFQIVNFHASYTINLTNRESGGRVKCRPLGIEYTGMVVPFHENPLSIHYLELRLTEAGVDRHSWAIWQLDEHVYSEAFALTGATPTGKIGDQTRRVDNCARRGGVRTLYVLPNAEWGFRVYDERPQT